ncbi:hypothetical protein F8M41_010382 [Gigaspora margarita]|uniref:Uncharacterized protein n=1 Tax=Gigaspora margarita TaxID=4874 RepID=A0A8H4A2H7_GIGMA|nr:hypothetical protein F8M41_010382 [Gigaspora margarita]
MSKYFKTLPFSPDAFFLYKKWGLFTWEEFYDDKYPNKSKEEARDSFRCDLDVLIIERNGKDSTKKKIPLMKKFNMKFLQALHCLTLLTVKNSLPNSKYLQLRPEKSSSSIKSVERRFPDIISSWNDFKSKVQSWNPESANI